MKRTATLFLALGIMTSLSAVAEAGPITIDIGSFSGGTGILHAPGTLADGLNVYLGAVSITGDLGAFESYCVDLQHYDIAGANQVTLGMMSDWNNPAVPGHPSLGGGAASWLYDTYGVTAVGNQSLEAALSLAIWNSLYDNDYSVSSGTGFSATSLSDPNYAKLADGMLGKLAMNIDPLPNNGWLQTQNIAGTNYAQDFLAPAAVPEPSTLMLFGTGMVSAAGFFRRRLRKGSLA